MTNDFFESEETSKRDLKDDLQIKEDRLSEDLIKQPSIYAYYYEIKVKKSKEVEHKKLLIDTFEAALDAEIRTTAVAKGEKTTESQISSKIKLNTTIQHHKRELIDLEAQLEQVDGILKALSHKKDMLITLAANIRAEQGMTKLQINNLNI